MKQLFITATLIGLVALTSAMSEVQMKPIKFGAFVTAGMFDGDTVNAEGNSGEIKDQAYSRIGGWALFNGSVGERLDISILLAAMKWYSLPVTKASSHTRNQLLSPGLGHAMATYKFGDVKNPYLTLKFGDFPYKYSPSSNLGEHLFKSGTYPGYLWTDHWQLIGGAKYNAQGLLGQLAFLNRELTVDLALFFEHGIEPNFDLSPGIVVSYQPFGGVLELGAGAVFSHLISVNEDLTTPKDRENAYYNGAPLTQDEISKPGLDVNSPVLVDSGDTRVGQQLPDSLRAITDAKGLAPVYVARTENGIPNSELEYYTFRGIKTMGRIAVRPFLNTGMEGIQNLTVYAEATLLGVKNYPFYYDKIEERLPKTFGIKSKLFNVLDELSVEVEHYKNSLRNNIHKAYVSGYPIWGETPEDLESAEGVIHDNSEWFWTVMAKKHLTQGITMHLKVARDHLRSVNFFGNPSDEPMFRGKNGWYFALKTEVWL